MKNALLSILITFCSYAGFSQKNIGTNKINHQAVMQIVSADSSKGMIVPKVTSVKRPVAADTLEGMIVYNITDSAFEYCTGYQWIKLDGNSINIYDNNGTLVGTRIVDMNGFDLNFNNGGNIGVGITSPPSKLSIQGDGDTTLTSSVKVYNSAGDSTFTIDDEGNVEIGQSLINEKGGFQVSDGLPGNGSSNTGFTGRTFSLAYDIKGGAGEISSASPTFTGALVIEVPNNNAYMFMDLSFVFRSFGAVQGPEYFGRMFIGGQGASHFIANANGKIGYDVTSIGRLGTTPTGNRCYIIGEITDVWADPANFGGNSATHINIDKAYYRNDAVDIKAGVKMYLESNLAAYTIHRTRNDISESSNEPFRNVNDSSGATNESTDIFYNGGNIGIGNATPQVPLTVGDGTNTSSILYFVRPASSPNTDIFSKYDGISDILDQTGAFSYGVQPQGARFRVGHRKDNDPAGNTTFFMIDTLGKVSLSSDFLASDNYLRFNNTSAGDSLTRFSIITYTAAHNYLNTTLRRHTAGSTWTGTSYRMQRKINSANQGFIDFGIDGIVSDEGLGFGSNSETHMVVESDGNVGIGTTTPDLLLDLEGQDYISKVKVGSKFPLHLGDNFPNIGFNAYNDNLTAGATWKFAKGSVDNYGGIMAFNPNHGWFSISVSDSSGAEGIGFDQSRKFILDRHGDIQIGGPTGSGNVDIPIKLQITNDSANQDIADFINSSSDTVLYIKDDGNIGVGITNPQHKLHILNGHQYVENLVNDEGTEDFGGSLRLDRRSDNSQRNVFLITRRGLTGTGEAFRIATQDDGAGNITEFQMFYNKHHPTHDFKIDSTGRLSFGLYTGTNFDSTNTTGISLLATDDLTGQIERVDPSLFGGGSGKFVDGTNVADAVYTGGNVGIGTTTPTHQLTLEKENFWSIYASHVYSNTSNHNGGLSAFKYRGSKITPLVVADGDNTLGFASKGYDGSALQFNAELLFKVDGTPTSGSVPGMMQFNTTTAGDAAVSTKMVIMNDGKVGIGTTSPLDELHVNQGKILLGTSDTAISDIYAHMQVNANRGQIRTSALNDANYRASFLQYRGGINSTGLGSLGDGAGNIAMGYLHVNDSRLTMDSTGDVGIGHVFPSGLLPHTRLEVINNDASKGQLSLINSANDTTLYVLDNGNVGIGTTNPTQDLHVNGVSLATAAVYSRADDASTRDHIVFSRHGDAVYNGFTNNEFAIGTLGDAASGTQSLSLYSRVHPSNAKIHAITFDLSGNVGIGTTTPNEKLEVTGRIRMVDGNQAVGKVLTSDANGTATWQDPSPSFAYTEVTTNYSILTTDHTVVVDCSGGIRTATLPSAASMANKKMSIKKGDNTSNKLILEANAAETIDGALTQETAVAYAGWIIHSNGTKWVIVGRF